MFQLTGKAYCRILLVAHVNYFTFYLLFYACATKVVN